MILAWCKSRIRKLIIVLFPSTILLTGWISWGPQSADSAYFATESTVIGHEVLYRGFRKYLPRNCTCFWPQISPRNSAFLSAYFWRDSREFRSPRFRLTFFTQASVNYSATTKCLSTLSFATQLQRSRVSFRCQGFLTWSSLFRKSHS